MFYFDPMYLLFSMPAILLVLFAQWKVRATYSKYTRVANEHGLTGVQVAQRLLQSHGLQGINLEGTQVS